MRKSFWMFMVVLLLSACSTDDGDDSPTVKLTDGTSVEQIVYAEETVKDEGIKFTATGPWTATVSEIVSSKAENNGIDWLTLSQYSGNAGEYTLKLTVKENLTGKDRKAQIKIQCGETTITVIIEQKAEKEGEMVSNAKPVRKIVYQEDNKSGEVLGYQNNNCEDFTKEFSYDEQSRVVRIVTEYPNDIHMGTKTLNFDYRVVNEIAVTETSESGTENYLVKLNKQGNAERIQCNDKGMGFEDYVLFDYDNDNRLTLWKDAAAEDENGEGHFSYTDGIFSKYEYISLTYPEENMTFELPVEKAYPHKYPNNGVIDFLGYIMMDDDYDFLFHIGRLGKSGNYLPEMFMQQNDYDSPAKEVSPYNTPNVTIPESYETVRHTSYGEEVKIEYRFDDDNCLCEIKIMEPFVVVKVEYDVVVGNELIYPEEPGMGYKYEIKNKKETDVRTDYDTYVYTISY